MSRSIPYGMTALFEAMNNAQYAEESTNEISNVMLGLNESVSYLDAVDAGLMSEDDVENDMDAELDADDEDETFKQVDSILPDSDEEMDDDLITENMDAALESYLDATDHIRDNYSLD